MCRASIVAFHNMGIARGGTGTWRNGSPGGELRGELDDGSPGPPNSPDSDGNTMTLMHLPAILCLLLAPALLAQPSVEYSTAKKIWVLHTDSSAYAVGVNPRGELVNLYWGGPLWRSDDIPQASNGRELSSFDPAQSVLNEEYVGWGGTRYLEPGVKITRADGGRDLVLHYASHTIDGDSLKIVLKDIKDDIF